MYTFTGCDLNGLSAAVVEEVGAAQAVPQPKTDLSSHVAADRLLLAALESVLQHVRVAGLKLATTAEQCVREDKSLDDSTTARLLSAVKAAAEAELTPGPQLLETEPLQDGSLPAAAAAQID